MKVDLCVLNDNLSPDTLKELQEKKVFDHDKTVIVIDQVVPANTPEQSAIQRQLMRLSEEQQISLYFGQGMTSHLICDGRVSKSQVVVAANPTVVAAGAVGAQGIFVDEKELVNVFEKGEVKETSFPRVYIKLEGTAAKDVTCRDIVLGMVQQLGAGGQKEKILSIFGDFIETAAVMDKIDFSILGLQTGAIGVIYEMPGTTEDDVITVAIGEIQPKAAIHNGYQDIQDISEMSAVPIKVVYIGGSTGGNFEDIKVVADAVRGKQIAYGLRLAAAPATLEIYKQIADAGYIQDILDAGGIVLNQCADPEIQWRIGENETMVSNDWKNIPGYAGYENSQVIITSTQSAVEAVLDGQIGKAASFVLEGRCWKFGDDIDTDIIIPTQYVCIPYEEMLHYAFAPLRSGMADLIKEDDIIVAGENFGCGSSREMAAEVIAGNGIRCIIAKSFARIRVELNR